MSELSPDHLRTLEDRCAYLEQRIKAKKVVKWDTQYDEREHAALAAALNILRTRQPVLLDGSELRDDE